MKPLTHSSGKRPEPLGLPIHLASSEMEVFSFKLFCVRIRI
jgi:hypothetical protein